MNSINIQFLGASGTVTGSKYLISAFGKKILIDCGLFQGLKELRLINWEPLPIDVPGIECVILTHGHLDHVGYLPRLWKEGFTGKIFCTEPTKDIASIILKDSAKLQEEEAEKANSNNYSKHKPAMPLYTLKDAENVLTRFITQKPDEWHEIDQNIKYRFRYVGHIIGACFIEMSIGDKTLVFSGDIGRVNDPLLFDPQKPEKADIVFIESTYGNKLHSAEAPSSVLKEIIENAVQKRGRIIIPSFAVERTQLLIYMLWKMNENKDLPEIPIYIDSPMADRVMDVFHKFKEWHKLDERTCDEMFKKVRVIKTIQESFSVISKDETAIIIAGSGMATGGRVLNYFAKYLGDPSATILLVGYQAEGTRGRLLMDGEKNIKFFGKIFEVRARISYLPGLSAHADQNGLIDWLSNLKNTPEKVFITHGEKSVAQEFALKLKSIYPWNIRVPKLYDNELL